MSVAAKPWLNPHVFSQGKFNWLSLPAETGQTVELPLPPVDDTKEVLVFLTAHYSGATVGEHYFAVFTRALDGGPVPFYYLFAIGLNGHTGAVTNSDNFWLRMPDKGLPRVAYVQKMFGEPLAPSESFTSGIALLSMR